VADRNLAVAFTLGGLAVATLFCVMSDGFYHDDDISHYLIAVKAGDDFESLLSFWGRPGFTIPAMLAERLGGLTGVRILSTLMTAATALLAWRIASQLGGRRAWLAPLLLWLQPLAITLAQTTLTETPATLYLTATAWLYLRGSRLAACAVASLLFVTRYEAAALLPVLAVALARDARFERGGGTFGPWRAVAGLLLLGWAPALYAGLGEVLDLHPESAPLGTLTRPFSDEYGSGSPLHFLPLWVIASGLGTLVLAAIGAARLGRRGWLPTALALAFFATQTLIFALGLFASGGYARFLVPAAGLVAALAACGAGIVGRRTAWILVGLTAAQAVALVRPLVVPDEPPEIPALVRPLAPRSLVANTVLSEALRHAPEGAPLFATHPFVKAHRPRSVLVTADELGLARWRAAGEGAILLHCSDADGTLPASAKRLGEVVFRRRSGLFTAWLLVGGR